MPNPTSLHLITALLILHLQKRKHVPTTFNLWWSSNIRVRVQETRGSKHLLGPVTRGLESQVPRMLASLNMEAKSQLLSLNQIIGIWLIINTIGSWLFYAQIFTGVVLVVGSGFLLDPTLNASPEPHLQKVLPCHAWDKGLGTRCKVVSPKLHVLNGWDCTYWPQVIWDLGRGTCVNRILMGLTFGLKIGLKLEGSN